MRSVYFGVFPYWVDRLLFWPFGGLGRVSIIPDGGDDHRGHGSLCPLSGVLKNIDIHDVKGFQCKACVMGKGKRLPSPSTEFRANRSLAVVHIDTWEPIRTLSLGGAKDFSFDVTNSQERLILHY
jgi:hypothetical protein